MAGGARWPHLRDVEAVPGIGDDEAPDLVLKGVQKSKGVFVCYLGLWVWGLGFVVGGVCGVLGPEFRVEEGAEAVLCG